MYRVRELNKKLYNFYKNFIFKYYNFLILFFIFYFYKNLKKK